MVDVLVVNYLQFCINCDLTAAVRHTYMRMRHDDDDAHIYAYSVSHCVDVDEYISAGARSTCPTVNNQRV